MIRAVFKKNTLRITGHANYCHGNDIVCAGVSAIAQTLVGYLMNLPGTLERQKVKPGDFYCAARGPEAESAFLMAKIGLLQLQKVYPDHVSVLDNTPDAAVVNIPSADTKE